VRFDRLLWFFSRLLFARLIRVRLALEGGFLTLAGPPGFVGFFGLGFFGFGFFSGGMARRFFGDLKG